MLKAADTHDVAEAGCGDRDGSLRARAVRHLWCRAAQQWRDSNCHATLPYWVGKPTSPPASAATACSSSPEPSSTSSSSRSSIAMRAAVVCRVVVWGGPQPRRGRCATAAGLGVSCRCALWPSRARWWMVHGPGRRLPAACRNAVGTTQLTKSCRLQRGGRDKHCKMFGVSQTL